MYFVKKRIDDCQLASMSLYIEQREAVSTMTLHRGNCDSTAYTRSNKAELQYRG